MTSSRKSTWKEKKCPINLLKKENQQNTNRLIGTENRLMGTREEGIWGNWVTMMKELRCTDW